MKFIHETQYNDECLCKCRPSNPPPQPASLLLQDIYLGMLDTFLQTRPKSVQNWPNSDQNRPKQTKQWWILLKTADCFIECGAAHDYVQGDRKEADEIRQEIAAECEPAGLSQALPVRLWQFFVSRFCQLKHSSCWLTLLSFMSDVSAVFRQLVDDVLPLFCPNFLLFVHHCLHSSRLHVFVAPFILLPHSHHKFTLSPERQAAGVANNERG